MQNVKQLVIDQPAQPIQQIYEKEQARYLSSEDSEVETLKDFVSIKHKLKYARGKLDPAMATSIDEVEVLERHKFIDRGNGVKEKFMILDNQKPNRIILFCSETGLKILSKSKKWHGTELFFARLDFSLSSM